MSLVRIYPSSSEQLGWGQRPLRIITGLLYKVNFLFKSDESSIWMLSGQNHQRTMMIGKFWTQMSHKFTNIISAVKKSALDNNGDSSLDPDNVLVRVL